MGTMGITFLLAFALMLVIEGLLPFLAPKAWRDTFQRLMQLSDGQLRFFGQRMAMSYSLDMMRRIRPKIIDVRPKNRICPSESCIRRWKVSRQSLGARNGSSPSTTSIRANAMSSVVSIGRHFRPPPDFPAESLR